MPLRCAAVLWFCLLLLQGSPSHAQTLSEREETERKLQELREQISSYERQLTQAEQQERSAEQTLRRVEQEIQVRRELITTYSRRARQLENESDSLRSSLSSLQGQIDRLRRQYRERILYAYKYGRMHDLALILSSESINQMLVRVRYLRRFSEMRRRQLAEIEQASRDLAEKRGQLQQTVQRNNQLLVQSQGEQYNLSRSENEHQRLVSQLRQQQSTLQVGRDSLVQQARLVEAQLARAIAAEGERSRAREEADPTIAAEAIVLTGSFTQNRGQLPWPVEGVVSQGYGVRVHPVYGTRTQSLGLEIATSPGAGVRTIFDGVVGRVFPLPGYGTCVMIRHGDFTSVYGNLSALNVSEGDRVQAGQPIGRAGTSEEPLGNALFFSLFSKGGHIDPVPWLARR